MLIFIRVSNNAQKFYKELVNQIKRFHAFFSVWVFCKRSGANIGKWFVILKPNGHLSMLFRKGYTIYLILQYNIFQYVRYYGMTFTNKAMTTWIAIHST